MPSPKRKKGRRRLAQVNEAKKNGVGESQNPIKANAPNQLLDVVQSHWKRGLAIYFHPNYVVAGKRPGEAGENRGAGNELKQPTEIEPKRKEEKERTIRRESSRKKRYALARGPTHLSKY